MRLEAEEISFGAICLHIDKLPEEFIWPPCLSKGRLATVWFTSQQLFPDVLTYLGRMSFSCKQNYRQIESVLRVVLLEAYSANCLTRSYKACSDQ